MDERTIGYLDWEEHPLGSLRARSGHRQRSGLLYQVYWIYTERPYRYYLYGIEPMNQSKPVWAMSRREMLKNSAVVAGGLMLGGTAFSGGTAAQPASTNGAADQSAQTMRESFSGQFSNYCTDELLTYEGTGLLTVRDGSDSNDGTHRMVLFNFSFQAVDEDGTRYTISERFRETFNARGLSGTETFMLRSNIVSHGPEANWTLVSRLHITFNANGEVTAYHVDFKCE
ncbi:hypothetical protein [Halalkalicoccus salilacus]|uniref:hypothetical protein n=1 Tax=Halalkalicoccus salilacus TaxID=3117459 RepID=UPI00300EF838